MYLPAMIISGIFLGLAVALCLFGCARGRAYFGHGSTDLGPFTHANDRSAVENIVGIPERMESGEQGYTAFYIYDKGYIGKLEAQDTITKIVYLPIMAWGELLTLGLLGVSLDHCQEVCQKGLLAVHYDLSDRLVTFESVGLPDDHPLLNGCTYNAPSSMNSFCLAIRDMARPSNLPPQ